MCPYIIKVIGLGLGLTIWDLSYMLMGWFTGYFGLFGIPKEDNVKTPSINYVGLVMVSLSLIFFFLGLCLWYFGHAGCDEQIGCRAGFKGRQAQSLWTDTALGLRSIIGIHWEKNQQCLRNEKLRVVAVGFTLEGCIEAQLSNASFSCFFVRSFAVAAGCCLNHSYTWRILLNAQNISDMNLSTRQRSRRSATEFFEAWCQEILKISMVTLAWNARLRPYLALLVDRTSMMLDPFRVPKPSTYRLLSVVCRRKRHTVVHVTSAQHCCSLIADACLLSWQVRWTLKMDSIEMPKSLRRISNAELRPRVHPRRLLASPWRS